MRKPSLTLMILWSFGIQGNVVDAGEQDSKSKNSEVTHLTRVMFRA